MNRINTFLELAVKQGGSDLHLISGQVPRIRLNGVLHRVRFRELTDKDLERLLDDLMNDELRRRLRQTLSVDFAYEVPELGRFRVNVHFHQTGLGACLRIIPTTVPRFEDLGLPEMVKFVISQPSGLTLVTGPTGSGKSTTLAALIDHINATRSGHIISIEEPIEFVHSYQKCVITQREIGLHAPTMAEALRNAVREDPDVILVGEMRDLESISLALTAAQTGIQVLGTLHTTGATRTVDRIVNAFPARGQDQIRTLLADSLRMIVSQRLVKTADGTGRALAAEVLVHNHASGAIIRSGHTHKLLSVIQAGGKSGMQSMDAVLKQLVHRQVITPDEAFENAIDSTQFERMLARKDAA